MRHLWLWVYIYATSWFQHKTCTTRNLGPKSDWGEIRGGVKFPWHQSRGPNSNALAYAECALSTYGRSTWALITLFVVDRNSPNFFCSTPKRSLLSTLFIFCHYLHQFQRHLRSNSKVVVNRTDFLTFFALPNFKVTGPNFTVLVSPNAGGIAVDKIFIWFWIS